MSHALIITKVPSSVGDKIIRSKREKFLVAIDTETIEIQQSNSDTDLIITGTIDNGEKRTYKFLTPNPASRSSWCGDITVAIEQAVQGYKAPRSIFHIVSTSSDKNTAKKTIRRKDSKRGKSSRILKLTDLKEEFSMTRISESDTEESQSIKGSSSHGESPKPTEKEPHKLLQRKESFIVKTDSEEAIQRRLVSTRSVPILPTFNLPLDSAMPITTPLKTITTPLKTITTPLKATTAPAQTPNPTVKMVHLQKEVGQLQEQVNALLAEKSEWKKREQKLNEKIQLLESKMKTDKENMAPLKNHSNEVYKEYKSLNRELRNWMNRFESFETNLSGSVEMSTLLKTERKTKK
jgi:hypothetical protein